ncbi:hypothetical protein ACWIGI_28670 [Nocardia sp. NPDC055321]
MRIVGRTNPAAGATMTAEILTPADARWFLTGSGLTDEQAAYAVAHMSDYGTPLTSTNLRNWAYTAL